jgi:2-keto-3-deoxy-L-fuconate dehydrogenase
MTHADRYISPPIVELFRDEGAHVIADESDYTDPNAAREVVARVGRIEVLIANFAGPLRNLDELVWPLLRFVRAALPIPGLNIYSAARGAQNAFVKVVGNEVAAHNVQFNAIGPAHIENNMYYTAEMLSDESIREQFVAEIPAGRLGVGAEAAELALALSTGASDFLAGQVIPISGGWAT